MEPYASGCAVNPKSEQQRTATRTCLKSFVMFITHSPVLRSWPSLLSAQRSWRDVMAAGEIFQFIEFRLRFAHALLKDFNAAFRSDAYVAVVEIYPARHRFEASCIFD